MVQSIVVPVRTTADIEPAFESFAARFEQFSGRG
jgi:hypothetical protein